MQACQPGHAADDGKRVVRGAYERLGGCDLVFGGDCHIPAQLVGMGCHHHGTCTGITSASGNRANAWHAKETTCGISPEKPAILARMACTQPKMVRSCLVGVSA